MVTYLRVLAISLLGLCLSAKPAAAVKAVFKTSKDYTFQVFIDGKLVNKKPKNLVKLKSYAGKQELNIKLYDRSNNISTEYCQEVNLRKGHSSEFTLYYYPDRTICVERTKLKRIHSFISRNPDKLYTKKLFAANGHGNGTALPHQYSSGLVGILPNRISDETDVVMDLYPMA